MNHIDSKQLKRYYTMLNMNALNKALNNANLSTIVTVESIGIENFTSDKGNIIANQFEILINGTDTRYRVFQSYETIIAVKCAGHTVLDENALEYSATTLKYLKLFLGTCATKKELYKRIEQGEYLTADLNK